MAFVAGNKSTFDNVDSDKLLDLKDGLDFLNPRQDGIALLKRLGTNGFTFANHKQEWKEVSLATRREEVTIDGSSTSLTVADAHQYSVNTLLKIEDEVVRVTAIASATVLTVQRAAVGTTAAVHTAALMFSLGTSPTEGSDAPAGVEDTGAWLYNFDQTFERAVSLTNDDIARLSVEGNPMKGQIERRFIEVNRELFQALCYGVRFQDTTDNFYTVGGFTQFVTTNVDDVAGALSVAAIDAIIKAIVDAGGDPKVMAMGTYQKQKLDALDANLVRIGKKEPNTGGNPMNMTWQSGILDHTVDIIVDHTILDDQLFILDTDYVEIGHKSHHGINGAFHIEDSTTPGADRKSRVLRGKYSARFRQEKSCGYLFGLT